MKNTITISKEKKETFHKGTIININVSTILVDGVKICRLTPISNAKNEGYDSRVKFTVSNFKNDLGLKFIHSGARSIKQVINQIESQL